MKSVSEDDLVLLLRDAASSYDVPVNGAADVLAAARRAPVPAIPFWRRPQLLQAAAGLAVVLVAGLGLTLRGIDSSSDSSDVAATASGGSAVQSQAGSDDSGTASTGKSTDTSADRSAQGGAAAAAPPAAAEQAGTAKPGVAPAPAAAGQAAPAPAAPAPDAAARIVKTGAIALTVADGRVTPTLTAVQRAAKAQGGYVQGSSTEESGTTPSGSVTLRVPVARFEELVAVIRGLDATVRSATSSGRDVTAQYADVDAQLRTLRATRERFLVILERTRTIGEVLTVQQRVDAVTGQIDRLEGQRKVLADRSALSTLEVTVTESDDPAARVEDRQDQGLVQAFRDGVDGFMTGVEGLIRHSGRVVLFLLCVAAALGVGRLGWRVSRRRLV